MHHYEEEEGCKKKRDKYKAKYGDYTHKDGTENADEFKTWKKCMKKKCFKHMNHECNAEPDVFTLVGHLGVSLMIFESGMHFHFPMLPIVGPK